ncbi:MAG: NADH-quinone oxidoreductase subunit H [Holosporales bacterium]|jgi:NADH-quinone oxidoreductase subunit H|nr:NADH-quinone oxidoreductase subunit H [Holosporales bacterium]
MFFATRVSLFYIVCVVFAAYLSLIERKLIAKIQLRVGPNHCGPCGVLQPAADAIKLLFKQHPFKNQAKHTIFAVCLYMAATLVQMTLIPMPWNSFSPRCGLLLVILTQSLIAFSEILIGSTSGSKYGRIGGNRAYLQTVGAHIPLILSVMAVMVLTKELKIAPAGGLMWTIKTIPLTIMFFISLLMASSRIPFDFVEAESELVAGAYVECGGILFAMIHLADYLNLTFISALTASVFFGGCKVWHTALHAYTSLLLETLGIICFVVFMRAILPRYQQDQMNEIAWLYISPLLLGCIFFFL